MQLPVPAGPAAATGTPLPKKEPIPLIHITVVAENSRFSTAKVVQIELVEPVGRND